MGLGLRLGVRIGVRVRVRFFVLIQSKYRLDNEEVARIDLESNLARSPGLTLT